MTAGGRPGRCTIWGDLLVQAEFGQADPQPAHAILQESTATWRELGERRHFAIANSDLGVSAIWQGDLGSSRIRLDESLATLAELNDVMGISWTIFNCAQLFVAHGWHEQAVRVLGAGSALLTAASGRALPLLLRALVEHRLGSARATLGTQIVAAAWSEGEAMSRDEAIAYTRQQLGAALLADVAPGARR